MNRVFIVLPKDTIKFLNTILGIKEVTLREILGIKYTILDDMVKPLN